MNIKTLKRINKTGLINLSGLANLSGININTLAAKIHRGSELKVDESAAIVKSFDKILNIIYKTGS